MAKIKLVTDSSIQLTPEEIETWDITVVPLTIMIDSTVYVDGETITRDEFMDKMAAASALPKTSQPPIGTFLDVYDKLTEDGSEVLSVHMLEAISGTVNSARQAAEICKGNVTVIDSTFTDRALAFQVLAAARLIKDGKTMPDILKAMATIRDHTTLVLGVSTLDNLVKGGRISRVSGMLSSLLNIKVILQVADGELNALQKGRGTKTLVKFVDSVADKLKTMTDVKAIGVSYAGGKAMAEEIAAKLRAAVPYVETMLRPTDPVIATHTGDGAFAIMYYVG
ncbi:DegV family protein [Lacticaseibacillus mingshuiensis]|uniref:DegV family protein n=1 Tax=Lacticaseibacillus mingshuiensis TaxID=2799574 RepID=A0ABW4CH23_9LACO|nr:DegV family protein [Lacticaseibacillus mingshuiensis]